MPSPDVLRYRWKLEQRFTGPKEQPMTLIVYFKTKAAVAKHLNVSTTTITNWHAGTHKNQLLSALCSLSKTDLPMYLQPDPVVLGPIRQQTSDSDDSD